MFQGKIWLIVYSSPCYNELVSKQSFGIFMNLKGSGKRLPTEVLLNFISLDQGNVEKK